MGNSLNTLHCEHIAGDSIKNIFFQLEACDFSHLSKFHWKKVVNVNEVSYFLLLFVLFLSYLRYLFKALPVSHVGSVHRDWALHVLWGRAPTPFRSFLIIRIIHYVAYLLPIYLYCYHDFNCSFLHRKLFFLLPFSAIGFYEEKLSSTVCFPHRLFLNLKRSTVDDFHSA